MTHDDIDALVKCFIVGAYAMSASRRWWFA
jgi:hypothetical protein